MESKSTYLLYGYFGTGNFGDDIILYSVVRNTLARDPEAKFLIRNHGPVSLETKFLDRIQCTDIEVVHQTRRSTITKFFALLGSYWYWTGRASTVVVGGGTLIHDTPALASTFLLLCLCLIAKIRRKKIIGIGLGAQRLKTFRGRQLSRILAKQFDRLCFRDELTLEQFKVLLPGDTRMVLTADLAYALSEYMIPAQKDRVIAVTLVDYAFMRFETAAQIQAFEILGATLAEFIENGYRIRLLALQSARPHLGIAGDHPVLERLLAAIPHPLRSRVVPLNLNFDPASITAAYGGVSLAIGMRFHSLVVAAMKGIPFVGLSDEPKIQALCEEYSMPCLIPNCWSEKELIETIREALGKTIDPSTLKYYHNLALRNFEDFP